MATVDTCFTTEVPEFQHIVWDGSDVEKKTLEGDAFSLVRDIDTAELFRLLGDDVLTRFIAAGNLDAHNIFYREAPLASTSHRDDEGDLKNHVLDGMRGLTSVYDVSEEVFDRLSASASAMRGMARIEPLSVDGSRDEDAMYTTPDEREDEVFNTHNWRADEMHWTEMDIKYDLDARELEEQRIKLRDSVQKLLDWQKRGCHAAEKPDIPHEDILLFFRRHLARMNLAFFAQFDGLIGAKIADLGGRVVRPGITAWFHTQAKIEDQHQLVYDNLLRLFVQDSALYDYMRHSIKRIPALKKILDIVKKYAGDDHSMLSLIILMFVMTEGVFFQTLFSTVIYIKDKGMFHALSDANNFILRDETQHAVVDVMLFLLTRFRPDYNLVRKIIREIMEPFDQFVTAMFSATEIFTTDTLGITRETAEKFFGGKNVLFSDNDMTAKNVCSYSRYLTNMWLSYMGYEDIFPEIKEMPLRFMTRQGSEGYANFFERFEDVYRSTKARTRVNINLVITNAAKAVHGDEEDKVEDEHIQGVMEVARQMVKTMF